MANIQTNGGSWDDGHTAGRFTVTADAPQPSIAADSGDI